MTQNARLPEAAEQLIRSRRSSRAFRPDPVPEQTIHAVLELAAWAPSASNAQPWQVEVVSGARRDELSRDLLAAAVALRQPPDFPFDQSAYSEAQNARRRQTGALVYEAAGIGQDDQIARWKQYLDNLRFFGAPHVAFVFVPANANALMCNDAGMYTQTLLLALAAHGIGSCTQGFIAAYPDIVRKSLGLTRSELLLYGVAFGYIDESAAINQVRTPRAPLSETVRFHH